MNQLTVANVKKYYKYIFQRRSFQGRFDETARDPRLRQVACTIRGQDRPPAIMIHGIMPRAGTVYVGQLLRLHPDVHAFPYEWWEVPFLQMSDEIQKLQEQFLVNHRHNRGKVGPHDFLTLFGSAIVAHLHAATPAGKRLLIKVPSVEYIHLFWTMYPHEQLLLLVRDGRDVVQSTINTWPHIRFSFACLRWRRAANTIYQFNEHYKGRDEGYFLARFEDAVNAPEAFVREACRRFGLDEHRYPFHQIGTVKVRGSSQIKENGEVDWKPKEKPEDFRAGGYWQQWPWHKKWLFKHLAGKALVELGYCENFDW